MSTSLRALIVDDEEPIRNAVVAVLQQSGFEAIGVASAEAAVATMLKESFDVAFVDKNLPGQSGVELLGWVRREIPSLPVVVITGYPTADSMKDTLNLGVDAYVEKPLGDIFDVVTIARSAVESRRAWERARSAGWIRPGAADLPAALPRVLIVTRSEASARSLRAPFAARAEVVLAPDGAPLSSSPRLVVVDAAALGREVVDVVERIREWVPTCRLLVIADRDLPMDQLRAMVRARVDRLLPFAEFDHEVGAFFKTVG